MRRVVVAVLLLVWTAALAEPLPSPIPDAVTTAPPVEKSGPPVVWSVVAGLATGLLSLAIGGALLATDNKSEQQAGTYVMMTGLALAPVVSHMVSREWKRAAIFGSIPTASLLGMTWLLQVHPQVIYEGNKDPTRIAFVVLVAFSVVSSAGGIVDSLWAGERARKHSLTLAPIMTRDRLGLALGGSF